MKKIVAVLVVLISLHVNAQKSFEKNANVVAFGLDLGYYNYTARILSNPKSSSDPALNKMLNLHYERAVINWLGVGAKVQLCDYITEEDSITHYKATVRAFDGSLLVNAHFLRTKRIDMLAGINVGYSTMNYQAGDVDLSAAKGGGLTYDIHLQPRFYFGDHIGMFINLAYAHYSYENMTFTNVNNNIPDAISLVGGGVNFGFGFQGKF